MHMSTDPPFVATILDILSYFESYDIIIIVYFISLITYMYTHLEITHKNYSCDQSFLWSDLI
jgi:hypothetical protein